MQRRAFAAQLAIARAVARPVIVHTREAEDDTRAMVVEAAAAGVRGVLHCFTGSAALAEAALVAGWYVSFSGIVTFKNSAALREIAKSVPADRFLVETDAPYLAPLPYRGKRNEPAYVVEVAKVLAEVRGMTLDELSRQTTENFFKLFSKVPRTTAAAA